VDVTDTQLLTLALAITLPLSLLMYSNSRITEAKETLRAEMANGNSRITEAKETLRAEMATGFMGVRAEFIQVRADFSERFNSIDRKLDEILRMVADHDTRLRSVEERLH
jgi:hypothetical protein